jgi:HNH endonuclease
MKYHTFISCPIKEIGCTAISPRWASNHYLSRTKGVCKTCAATRKSINSVRKLLSEPRLRLYKTKAGLGRLQIFIACPNLFVGCTTKKPRWVWVDKRFYKIKGSCRSCSTFQGGWIDQWGYKRTRMGAEHRLIMEQMLGRKLRKGETVHHKNAKRADNRQQNLELRMAGRHPKGWSLRQMREYLKTVPRQLGGLK